MLHSFFNRAFKASKWYLLSPSSAQHFCVCLSDLLFSIFSATLLKLTIPRTKLLRNIREVQLKQMRRDIAKLLEAGQEAKAIVEVEYVMREENMMSAQDIIQLFCELIVARLPMIQSQRECPLDLKEAISSVCFAAPRCADLPELLQVQLLFASKYGKEFVSAATELTPDCSVNRQQLIELLSVQSPSQEKKLNLLKDIAVEHKLDWDPTASETKFFKKHEDLLNGPIQFCSQCESKLPLPEEKHSEVDLQSGSLGSDKDKSHTSFGKKESKQFVPFISRPSISPKLFSERCGDSTPSLSGTRTEANLDLQEVMAAAETAENAAAEARSASSLAQVCINKLTKKNSAQVPDSSFENPFYAGVANNSEAEREHFTEQNTADDYDGGGINDVEFEHTFPCFHSSSFPSFDTLKEDCGSSLHNHSVTDDKSSHHRP
ncbi:IST1-like protein [Spatholobus suberectus]|nr:IST1-like protein [Spatholobus suberectus]